MKRLDKHHHTIVLASTKTFPCCGIFFVEKECEASRENKLIGFVGHPQKLINLTKKKTALEQNQALDVYNQHHRLDVQRLHRKHLIKYSNFISFSFFDGS